MEKMPFEEAEVGRTVLAKRFWDIQFKQKCFYNCGSCVIKKHAISVAKKAGNIEDIRNSIETTEACESVAT